MKNELFEQGMAKFLKSLTEQQPGQQPGQQPVPGEVGQVGQPPVGQPPAPPEALAPEPVATEYIDTQRLFYTKPPTDSSDWVNDVRRYPRYKPLSDRVVPYLDKLFGKSFIIQRAGAARYNPNQFRISLRGTVTAPTTLKYENDEIKIVEMTIPTLQAKQAVIKDPKRANAEPLRYKPVSPAPEEKVGAEEYKSGEEVSAKDIDSMIAQFAESIIYEVRLAQPEKQVKAGAWSKLEEPFRNWFAKQIIAKNPKSFVDHHMSTKEGREFIKQEFIKFAEHHPKIDKRALEAWVGKPKEKEKAPEAKVPEEIRMDKRFDEIVGTAQAEEYHNLNKKEAERYAEWVIKNVDPKTDEELGKAAISTDNYKAFKQSEREKMKEERLETFLRKILVEARKGRKKSPQPGEMGEKVQELSGGINNVVDDWMDNNSLIGRKGGDIKTCDINFMTANDLRFEVQKLMTADGSGLQKTWDGKETVQVVGNMIMKVNVLVDARIRPNGKTWEFRTYDTHNNPIVKDFRILTRDAEPLRAKVGVPTKASVARGPVPFQPGTPPQPTGQQPAAPPTGGTRSEI